MFPITKKNLTKLNFPDLRSKYKANREILSEESIQPKDPLNLFKKWYDEACATPEILEPWTVSLATVDKSGLPSIRYVWLKDFVEDEGFMFFTNYASKKAQDIEANPNVAIAAYWLPLQKSVKIQGVVKKVAQEVSAKHFHSRPRATQIGFLVSPQTQVIAGREVLDDKERKMQQELGDDKEVPMPNWVRFSSLQREEIKYKNFREVIWSNRTQLSSGKVIQIV